MPIFVGEGPLAKKVLIPTEDYPFALSLPEFSPPPAMLHWSGHQIDAPPLPGAYIHFGNYKPTVLREKYGIIEWSPPRLNILPLARMIAKIGFCVCVAQRGLDGFNPIINSMLVEEDLESRSILPYIGCQNILHKSEALHQTHVMKTQIAGIDLVVAAVKLFDRFDAPTYLVVVGTEVGQVPPPLPDNPAGVDGLHKFYSISVRPPSGRPMGPGPHHLRFVPSNAEPQQDDQ